MEIKIERITETAKLPTRAHDNDAGLDLYSDENLILLKGKHGCVKTNIKIEIPDNYVGLVWDKSGLSKKHGIHTLAGVIDSGYRGEIIITLANLGLVDYKIEKGQKIAQLLIQPIAILKIIEKKIDEQTERGSSGFGSTGLY
ncbi:MAG: dUTP diphosphatase [bacterium]